MSQPRSPLYNSDEERAAAYAKELVYTPAQAGVAARDYYADLLARPGVQLWGVPEIDRTSLRARGGDVIGIVGRPGHGKSTTLSAIAKNAAEGLVAEGLSDKEIVVYITLEQSVEEMEALFQAGPGHTATDFVGGHLSMEAVEALSFQRPSLPIWTIGRSMKYRKRPTIILTADNIFWALRGIQAEFGVKIRLVLLDYIQILPVENYKERNAQVAEAIISSKELGQALDCPLVFGVQAGRSTDGREDKLPTMADLQWASQLEQTADKLFSVGRPWLWRYQNPRISIPGLGEMEITEFMFIIRKLKERFNSAGQTYLLHMAPELARLTEREAEFARANPQSLHA